jgi:hypothetical protein
MLGSITPLGERGRRSSWGVTVTSFIAAASVTSAALGALVGLAGHVLMRLTGKNELVPLLVFSATLMVSGLLDLSRVPPGIRRQVDDAWLYRYRGWFYGAVTVVISWSIYALLAGQFLSGSSQVAAIAGLVFGSVRSGVILLTARVRHPVQLGAILHRLTATDLSSRRVTAVAQACLGALGIWMVTSV